MPAACHSPAAKQPYSPQRGTEGRRGKLFGVRWLDTALDPTAKQPFPRQDAKPAKFTKPEAWPKAWGVPRFTERMGGEFIWQSGGQEPPSPTSAAKAMEVKRLWRSRRGGMPEVRCPMSEVRGHFDRIYRMFRMCSTINHEPSTTNFGNHQP